MFFSHPLVRVLLIAFFMVQCSSACKNTSGESDNGDTTYTTVYITPTGKKYHMEDCRSLRKNKTAVTVQEAIEQGYEACKICKPPGTINR